MYLMKWKVGKIWFWDSELHSSYIDSYRISSGIKKAQQIFLEPKYEFVYGKMSLTGRVPGINDG